MLTPCSAVRPLSSPDLAQLELFYLQRHKLLRVCDPGLSVSPRDDKARPTHRKVSPAASTTTLVLAVRAYSVILRSISFESVERVSCYVCMCQCIGARRERVGISSSLSMGEVSERRVVRTQDSVSVCPYHLGALLLCRTSQSSSFGVDQDTL